MRNTKLLVICVALFALVGQATADPIAISGVVGMNPVPEGAYAAVWVPVPAGQALAGLRWYNNDVLAVFPQVLVASGTPDAVASLAKGPSSPQT